MPRISSIARSSQIRSSSCRCPCRALAGRLDRAASRISGHLSFPFVDRAGRDLRPARFQAPLRDLRRAALRQGRRAYSSRGERAIGPAAIYLFGRMEAAGSPACAWRHRGAWLWPTFVVADAGRRRRSAHALPMLGDSAELRRRGRWSDWSLNVLAVVLLSRPAGRAGAAPAPARPAGRRWPATTPAPSAVVAGHAPGSSPRACPPVRHPLRRARAARRRRARGGLHRRPRAGPRSAPTSPTPTPTRSSRAASTAPACRSRTARRTYCVIVKPRCPSRERRVRGYEPNSCSPWRELRLRCFALGATDGSACFGLGASWRLLAARRERRAHCDRAKRLRAGPAA